MRPIPAPAPVPPRRRTEQTPRDRLPEKKQRGGRVVGLGGSAKTLWRRGRGRLVLGSRALENALENTPEHFATCRARSASYLPSGQCGSAGGGGRSTPAADHVL